MAGEALGVYIHIPFCRARCRYCDFNTYSGLEHLIPEYTQALLRELESWKALSPRVNSIYFGGGTPGLLPPENIKAILDTCRATFHIAKDAEITLEANPRGFHIKGEGYLKIIKSFGVNRLSLGVQSFDDYLLKTLGRIHNASEAREAFVEARRAGFDNINLDLIYGLPSQTMEQWRSSLDEAIELNPEHVSLYALTLEEETPLYSDIASGALIAPDSDLAADMYTLSEDRLEKAGYIHYEISNWAKPGRECRHNLNYWQSGLYVGIGAGAHSCLKGERYWNVAQPVEYIRRIKEARRAVLDNETITLEIEKADYIILRLRLMDGLDLREFTMRYGDNIGKLYGVAISFLVQAGLLEELDGKLRLTARGRLLGNEVFQRFLPKIKV